MRERSEAARKEGRNAKKRGRYKDREKYRHKATERGKERN
jgi:hypothetical protein